MSRRSFRSCCGSPISQVRLPRMQVVTLERLAALDGETVSAVLARELRDLVSVHGEWLSAEVVGFAEALAWPMA